MSEKDDNQPLWQGRGHFEFYGDDEERVQLFGSPPSMTISPVKPTALEVAQQIIDQFEPGHTVASWKEVEGVANVVELQFTDGTHRKLVGLFAHHILSAHYRDTHRC